jgi:hypothetical protein
MSEKPLIVTTRSSSGIFSSQPKPFRFYLSGASAISQQRRVFELRPTSSGLPRRETDAFRHMRKGEMTCAHS